MTACVNCSRALQPAWKYCIYCGTRTAVAAVAPRSRPLPKRTPVPGFASVSTQATPIVPPPAPAPLAAAPNEPPVSSVWPEALGERPSLRSALAATEVPMPTPPREVEVETPEGQQAAPEPEIFRPPVAVEPEPEPEPQADPDPEAEAESEPGPEPAPNPDPEPAPLSIADLVEHEAAEPEPEQPPEPRRSRRPGRRSGAPTGTLVAEREVDPDTHTDDELADDAAPEYETDPERDRTGSVNTLAILALLMGVLASPLAALFGHLALGQLKVSGERGIIPAWIAVVLGYLWLGFFIVLGITYLATNG
jgi:hypothetical protein